MSGNIGANPATACNDTHRRGLMGYHPVVHLAYKMSPTGLTSFLGINDHDVTVGGIGALREI